MNRTIRTEHDRDQLLTLLRERKLPFVVSAIQGEKRSHRQNRLMHEWFREVAEQLEDRTAEWVKGDSKLRFGVPILRYEDAAFKEKYDEHVKPLPYETKMVLMMEPFNFPVSSLMTTEQCTRYLNTFHEHYSSMGVMLTEPDEVMA